MHLCELMWRNPTSTTQTRLLRNQFSLASLLTISISHFLQEGQNNKEKYAHIPWAMSSPQPAHPRYIAPNHIYHIYPAKRSAIPLHAAAILPRLITARGMLPFYFAKIFSSCTLTLFLPLLILTAKLTLRNSTPLILWNKLYIKRFLKHPLPYNLCSRCLSSRILRWIFPPMMPTKIPMFSATDANGRHIGPFAVTPFPDGCDGRGNDGINTLQSRNS